MNIDRLKDAQFEALLRLAVIEAFEEEMAALPPDEEIAKTHVFSDAHERRMKRLFARVRREEIFSVVRKISYRAVASIVAATVILGGVLLFNADVRAELNKMIVEWFSQFTRFTFENNIEISKDTTWRPGYLPEGFAESDVFVFDTLTRIEYANTEGAVIVFRVSEAEGSATSIDNEHNLYYTQVVDDLVYHIFTALDNDSKTHIIWENEGWVFDIYSEVSADELVKMAFSIIKIKF